MFDPQECSIPTVYCGTKKKIPTKEGNDLRYTRKGTPYECMTKGYGAGMHSEKAKHLPKSSLQRIKYIGDVHEENFRKKKIATVTNLVTRARVLTKDELRIFLEEILLKKDGTIDMRAYNSVLLYLYSKGVYENLPACTKIKDL